MSAHIPRGSVTVFPLPGTQHSLNKGPQLRLLLFPSTCLDLLFAPVSYPSSLCNKLPHYSVSSSNKFTAYYSVSLGKGSRHSFLGPLALGLSRCNQDAGVSVITRLQLWGGGDLLRSLPLRPLVGFSSSLAGNVFRSLPGGPLHKQLMS